MKKHPSQFCDNKIVEQQFRDISSGVDFHWWHTDKTELHSHEYYEIGVITKGTTRHVYNDVSSVVVHGDTFLLKPGDYHVFQPLLRNNKPFSQLNFSVRKEEMQQICDVINPTLFRRINEFAPHTIRLKDTQVDALVDIVNQLYIQFDETQNQKNATLTKWAVFEICVQFDMLLHKQDFLPEWFSEFLEKIQTAEYFTMPVSQLYHLAPYSQSMLNRYFKQYTGDTLIGYIKKLKHKYACNLLIHSDYTTTQIAIKLSYTISHFNHEFQRREGMSPSEYRKTKLPKSIKIVTPPPTEDSLPADA